MTPPSPQVNGESIYSSFPWRVQFDSSDKKTWYTTSKVRCLCSELCVHSSSLATLTGWKERVRHHFWLRHSWYVSSQVCTRPLTPYPSPPLPTGGTVSLTQPVTTVVTTVSLLGHSQPLAWTPREGKGMNIQVPIDLDRRTLGDKCAWTFKLQNVK